MTLSIPAVCLENIKTAPYGLFIVSTPIGNLADITLRALHTLNQVDLIACEDTRVSKKLLQYYGIKTKTQTYHDHNAEIITPLLIEMLSQKRSVALISDAGTPLISDPGYKLVQAAIAQNIPVYSIPGPSAVLAGLVTTGLPQYPMLFAGFMPSKFVARQKFLYSFQKFKGTLILFESPARLLNSLTDCLNIFGDRPSAICREITKIFEETNRGLLSNLLQLYQKTPTIKGEFVIAIDLSYSADISTEITQEKLVETLKNYLQHLSLKEAARQTADELGIPRKTAYQQALLLRESCADK